MKLGTNFLLWFTSEAKGSGRAATLELATERLGAASMYTRTLFEG